MSFPLRICGFILLLFTCRAGLRAEVHVGDAFPPLSVAGVDLPAATGKVVLVDFWASWCAPCKESFRTYAQMHADYHAHGLVIVAVSVDEKQGSFDSFVKKLSPPFIVTRDRHQQLVRQVGVPAMPTCYLLGRDGRVRFVHQGFYGAETGRLVRQEIDSLLAETAPAP